MTNDPLMTHQGSPNAEYRMTKGRNGFVIRISRFGFPWSLVGHWALVIIKKQAHFQTLPDGSCGARAAFRRAVSDFSSAADRCPSCRSWHSRSGSARRSIATARRSRLSPTRCSSERRWRARRPSPSSMRTGSPRRIRCGVDWPTTASAAPGGPARCGPCHLRTPPTSRGPLPEEPPGRTPGAGRPATSEDSRCARPDRGTARPRMARPRRSGAPRAPCGC